MRRITILFLLLPAMLAPLLSGTALYSCQCMDKPPIRQAANEAYVVFVGRVTRYEDQAGWWRRLHDKLFTPNWGEITVEEYERLYGFRVTFDIEQSIKGKPRSRLTIITGRGYGDCGYIFQVGERYLVYAYRRSDGLPCTNTCSRTKLAASAQEEIVELHRAAS